MGKGGGAVFSAQLSPLSSSIKRNYQGSESKGPKLLYM